MKTIAIDFDGVLHKYSEGWADGSCYDEPVEGSEQFLRTLLDKGYSVFILSTRDRYDIWNWCRVKYPALICTIITEDTLFWNDKIRIGITNNKLPAFLYIDDRGVKFEGDFDKMLEVIQDFKTWQGK